MLSLGDWAVVLVYLAVVMALGLYLARGQRSRRDYFLGGRALSFWSVGLSIIATETSALTFIGVPALAIGRLVPGARGGLVAQGGNLLFLQIVFGYVIARFVVAVVMVPHYFRGDVYTPYQLLQRAFGPWPRHLAAALALVNMCLQAGVRVYVTAIPLTFMIRPMVPGWTIWWSMLLFTVVSIVYTAFGGVTAVIWTDVVQFFVFVAGAVFTVFYIPQLLAAPSGATGWAALLELGQSRFHWFSWGVVGRAADQSIWSFLLASVARLFGGEFNIWMGLVGATVGVMVSHGADQLNVQRVLACRDEQHGRWALLLSAAIILPLMAMFLLIGVELYAFYVHQGQGFDLRAAIPWDPSLTGTGLKADYVFPIFIVTRMPGLVRGLLIAGILAAAMSSLTSALSAIASVAVMDLLRPLARRARALDPRSELRLGRYGTLLIGGVLVAIAWWAKDAPLVFDLVFSYAGIFSGAKLGSLLFAIWRRRGQPMPVIVGMLTSAVLMAGIVWSTGHGRLRLNWPWYSFIGAATCLTTAWLLDRRAAAPIERDIDRATADDE